MKKIYHFVESPRSSEQQVLTPPEEKPEAGCLKKYCTIETAARGLTYYGTVPQMFLTILLFYSLIADPAESEKKNLTLYDFIIAVALLIAISLGFSTIYARGAVLGPFVSSQARKLYKKVSLMSNKIFCKQADLTSEKIIEEKEVPQLKLLSDTDEEKFTERTTIVKRPTKNKAHCNSRIAQGILVSTNLIGAANITLVFSGLCLVACDVFADTLKSSEYKFLNSFGDICGSIFAKSSFFIVSSMMNMLCFYNVQEHSVKEIYSIAKSNFQYYMEDRNTTLIRQQYCKKIRYFNREIVKKINSNLIQRKYSNADYEVLFEDNLTDLMTINLHRQVSEMIQQFDIEKEDALLDLGSWVQVIGNNDRNFSASSPLVSKRQYFLAFCLWSIAMVGIWNFFFLQRQGIKFLLKEVFNYSEESAIHYTNLYADWGAKYIMIFNMCALFRGVIARGFFNLINHDYQLDVRNTLPGIPCCKSMQSNVLKKIQYGIHILFFAAVATFPNESTTLAALEDANINYKSSLAIFLQSCAVLGILIFEVMGLHRDAQEQALRRIKTENESESIFIQALELPDLLEKFAEKVQHSPSRVTIRECLSQLLYCCRKKNNNNLSIYNDEVMSISQVQSNTTYQALNPT